jgi:hypothetical protein
VTRVQGISGAMPFEHLFNERHADLKETGNFGNRKAAFFYRCHHTNS